MIDWEVTKFRKEVSLSREPENDAVDRLAILGLDGIPDLVRFYLHFNEGDIHKIEGDRPYHIMPISACQPVCLYFGDKRLMNSVPMTWIAVVESHDGTVVAVDTNKSVSYGRCIVCFPDTFHIVGYRPIVAISFSEFIQSALRPSPRPYWLEINYVPYDYV